LCNQNIHPASPTFKEFVIAMATVSETNPTRFRKRILIKTTIDDRPRHKHQFGTLPCKEVLKGIIKWTKKNNKKTPATKAPRWIQEICCTKKLGCFSIRLDRRCNLHLAAILL